MHTETKNAGFSPQVECCDIYRHCRQKDFGPADLEIIQALEVLIVAADGGFSRAMGAMLQDQGYQVYLAPDVATAVEELDNYHFDLLVVHLGRGDQAGLAAVRQARQLESPPKIMVINGPQGKMFPVEAFEVDVDDYLIFPFTMTEFARRTAALLGPAAIAGGGAQDRPPASAQAVESLLLLMDEIKKALLKASAALQGLQRREVGHLSEGEAKILDEAVEHICQASGLAWHFYHKISHLSPMNGW